MRDLGSSFREYGPRGRILEMFDNYRKRKYHTFREEMTFFGAQKGLWGGRRGSVFLSFRKKRVKYF